MKKLIIYFLPAIISGLIFILVWYVFVRLSHISDLVLPGPDQVLNTIYNNASELLYHGSITLGLSVLGLLIAKIMTIICIVGFYFFPLLKKSIYPWLIGIRAVPIIVLAPLISIWVGTGLLPKIILSTLISFFPIIVSSLHGLYSIDREIVYVWKTFNISKGLLLYKIKSGYILPYFLNGMQIASTFAIIGTIVSEFSSSNYGIGYLIKHSTYYTNTSLTLAGIIISGLIGIFLYQIVTYVKFRLLFRQKK